jgi:CRISPR system Cascade subunit CasE
MYLSCFLIDVGDNPDRPRPGRKWLRNLYHVHQRLCMAFPSASRKSHDPDFLKSFDPRDFGNGQVHVARKAESGFLFRIDPQPGGRVVILVQSAVKPEWDYAFHNAGYLLAAPPQVKPFDPSFKVGQRLRFRLVANPTRRLSKRSLGADGKPIEKGIGKRVPVPTDQLSDWLARQAEKAGFSVEKESASVSPSYVYVNKAREDNGVRLRSVRYDGTLTVTDSTLFREAMRRGIGPGKAFGFGLLSVAPCHTPLAAEAP